MILNLPFYSSLYGSYSAPGFKYSILNFLYFFFFSNIFYYFSKNESRVFAFMKFF